LISIIRGFGLLAIALLLSACAQNACPPGPHLGARALPPLVVPEGLDAPDRQMALRVPDVRTAPGRPMDDPGGCIVDPPSFYAEPGEPNPDGLPVRPTVAAADGALREAPSRVTRDVTRFVEDWAAAWSERDFNAWVQYYEPDFTPEGYESNAAWRSDQEQRFGVDATTRIDPDSVRVNLLTEGRVRVRFVQQFGLGEQDRAVVKELLLNPQTRGAGWLIAEDYVVEVL
jgi:hypothetical protein